MTEIGEARSVLLISHRFTTVRLADRIHWRKYGTASDHWNTSSRLPVVAGHSAMVTLRASSYFDAAAGDSVSARERVHAVIPASW